MALVVLTGSDLSLLADPIPTRVPIPHLIAAPLSIRYDGTAVRFAGDELPTGFMGEGSGIERQLTCLYGGTEQNELAALLGLLETARRHPDPRMILRTHIGQVAGFDPAMAVVCYGAEVTPQRGQIVQVALTVSAVQWDGLD